MVFGATAAQVVERVGQCSEGWLFDPLPCHLCHGRGVLGQDTSPTLPHVNVYDCCMCEGVVGGAVGAEWQPRFRQSAPGQLWLLL